MKKAYRKMMGGRALCGGDSGRTAHGRRLCDIVGGAVSVALLTAYRCQSVLGDSRLTAHYSKAAYKHPLAPTDPATRNVAIPDSAHTRIQCKEGARPAVVLQKKAQRALLMQLQQEVLWEGTVLDDVNHKLIQHFIKLGRNPKFRAARNLMTVGGKEMIRELCGRGQVPHHLLITEGKEVPAWARRQRGMEIVPVKDSVAQACCPDGNDGYIGDFDIPAPPDKERLIANQHRMQRVLVLDNVDDAGLLGTLMRTAAGLQYDAVITTNHCADLYDHHVVRAARGAHFQPAVPFYTLRDEDGDDVYGMLNHVIRRNGLKPVCYAGQNDAPREAHCNHSSGAMDTTTSEEAGASTGRHGFHWAFHDASRGDGSTHAEEGSVVFHSCVAGARPVRLPTLRELPPAYAESIVAQAKDGVVSPCAMRLTDFCLRHFTATTSDAHSSLPRDDTTHGMVHASHDSHEVTNADCGSVGEGHLNEHYGGNASAGHREETPHCRGSARLDARDSRGDDASGKAPAGLMVFLGPNHTQTMLRRLRQSVSRPVTQLLLDADVPADTDALIAFSVVLHTLRPGGEQDYLPMAMGGPEQKRSTGEAVHQPPASETYMCTTASVDIGPNRLDVSEKDLNWDEAEQEREAHLSNAFVKWSRLHRRKRSDYEYWTEAEEARVRAMAREERRQRSKPWMARRPDASRGKGSTTTPDWVPNIIDEYRQPLTRDRLVQEQAVSTAYKRPTNYER